MKKIILLAILTLTGCNNSNNWSSFESWCDLYEKSLNLCSQGDEYFCNKVSDYSVKCALEEI